MAGPTDARGLLLVTGASAGIGAATARLAATDGWDVAVHYNRNRAGAEAVAAAVIAAGRRAALVQADLTDSGAVCSLFAAVDATGLPLAGLANNAGIVDRAMPVAEMTAERIARMMQVNVVAPMLVAGQAVRRMSTGRGGAGGTIVNLSSRAAILGSPGQYVDYAAAKGAIDTFTRGLALEVASEGIRVNGVRPGIIDTGIHAHGGRPDLAAEVAAGLPLGRAGDPDEVARGILWLLGPASSYVTGAILDISGGR